MGSVQATPPGRIIDDLIEILGVEGPMFGLSLYRTHARAAGSLRLRSEPIQIYDAILARALREGRIAEVFERVSAFGAKTVHLPDSPAVVVRELGPRDIFEVPRSELRALADLIGIDTDEGERGKRRLLSAYGLRKLTEKTDRYLDECFDFLWED